MKIAVCFSGETRTWKQAASSIKHFFLKNNHEVCFFGHAWSNNTWGNHHAFPEPESLNPIQLRDELLEEFSFSRLHVEPHKPVPDYEQYTEYKFPNPTGKQRALNSKIPTTWTSPFYSAMMSNHYKYSYEQDNDMSFDLVVHARYDVCYEPSSLLTTYLPHEANPQALYCFTHYFEKEYMMPCINDVFYFGSSNAMDLVESFYRVYHNGDLYKLLQCDYFDGGYKTVGPGVLLYKWLGIKNILPIHTVFQQMPVIRQNAIGFSWPDDFNKIMEAYRTW